MSVSSQADTEHADLARERHELATQPQAEEDELAGIYERRGLDRDLARTVARQLTAKGALAARVGGAPVLVGAARVTIWGVLAMLTTALVGRLFGAAVL